MPPRSLHQSARQPTKSEADASLSAAGLETLRAKVTELIPEYGLVHAETEEGRGLALTAKTAGIDLASLRVGQTVECVVTLTQPRVVRAHTVA